MSLFSELLDKFLDNLQRGIKVPIRVDEDTWGEKWIGYQDILKAYCTSSVAKMVFLSKYKSLPQIETLSNEDKIGWRKFVNGEFPETTPEFRLDAIKIIYTIGVLTS